MLFSEGTRLGPYQITAPIGAGGMGEVYKARDTSLDRTVAIKVIAPTKVGDAHAQQRFAREAGPSRRSAIRTSVPCSTSDSRMAPTSW